MKKFIALITIALFTVFNLNAQIDTVYNLGFEENRISIQQINERIKIIETNLENDTLEWIARFEVMNEELENDTLIQYVGIKIIAQSLLSEEEKIEARLNYELPEFSFEDLNDKTITSKDFEGKVILINTWFTRCPPCIAEMPHLNQIKNDYQGKDIEFVSMAPEDKSQIIAFLKKHHFQFRHIPDADDFLKKFGVGFPKNILIDKNGIIRYIGGGLVDGLIEEGDENNIEQSQVSEDFLRVQIDKLLSE